MKWDGIRGYEARNILRDFMPLGTFAFFYMSGVKNPAIWGIIKVVRESYPDDTYKEDPNPWLQVALSSYVDIHGLRMHSQAFIFKHLRLKSN